MKVRGGFVSNSSTTSFSIYGAIVDLDIDVIRNLKEKFPSEYKDFENDVRAMVEHWSNGSETDLELSKILENGLDNLESLSDEDGAEFYDTLSEFDIEITEYLPYDHWWDYDSSIIYVGSEWVRMKPDETRKKFEKRIRKDLQALFGKDIECGALEGTISG